MLLMQLVELTAKIVAFPRSPIIDSIIAIIRHIAENKSDILDISRTQNFYSAFHRLLKDLDIQSNAIPSLALVHLFISEEELL